MKYYLILFCLIYFFSCNQRKEIKTTIKDIKIYPVFSNDKMKIVEKNKDKTRKIILDSIHYNYDSLKNNYQLIYYMDYYCTHACLLKDGKNIKEIDTGKGLMVYMLGRHLADFNEFFLFHLAHRGSANEQLIEKKTGNIYLAGSTSIYDFNEENELLLYSDSSNLIIKNKMKLLDLKKRRVLSYNFPKEILGKEKLVNKIKFKEITDTSYSILFGFLNSNNEYKKTFSRK